MAQKTLGIHIIQELYDCDVDMLGDQKLLERIIADAQLAANATLLSTNSHQFQDGGASQIQFLAESHISIHTWTEYRYQAVDVYTCGNHTIPYKQIEYIATMLKSKRLEQHMMQRGIIDKILKV